MKVKFDVKKGTDYLLFTTKCDQMLTSNCVYFREHDVLVDPGNPVATPDLIAEMQQYGIHPQQIRTILYTHLHIDHIGAYWLFPNATLFAPEEEIECFLTENQYFVVNQDIYCQEIRQCLLKAVSLLTKHPYEKALTPMSNFLTRFSHAGELSTGQNGYLVFPSHTPGSAIIIFNKTALLGDIFSMENKLAWVPTTLKEKIDLLHTVKVYGKKNLISGHEHITTGLVHKTDVSAIRSLDLPMIANARKKTVKRHVNCDIEGNITSEYYLDQSGNKTCHKDGFYAKKFSYNRLGKICRETFLNADGQIVADSNNRYGVQYNYNENGRWVLLTDIDRSSSLRRNKNGDYFTSVYFYTSPHVDQIAARVDFRHGTITHIKYLVDNFIVEPEEAFRHYQVFTSKLEQNLLY